MASVKTLCDYLDIEFVYEIASNIAFDRSLIRGAGDWALSITKKLGGNVYVNPPGGVKLFDEDKYNKQGVDLLFLKPHLSPYRQSGKKDFVPGLSIVDLLMFNGVGKVRDMIKTDFSFCSKDQLITEDIRK